MRSKLFWLNVRDFVKGLIVALFAAIVTFLHEELLKGSVIDIYLLKRLGLISLITFLSYLLKNYLTDENGKILSKI